MTILMEFDVDFCLVNLIPFDKIVVVCTGSNKSGLETLGISALEKLELGRLPAKELSALLWTLTPNKTEL